MFRPAFAAVALLAAPAFAEPSALHDQVDAIRVKANVPAVGVLVSGRGKVVLEDCWGEAKPDDAWHIGSDTKAMTATLAARLVDAGKIKWTTPLGDACPTLKGKVDDAWLAVTLEQWLTQTSGTPRSLETPAMLNAMRDLEKDATLGGGERRERIIAQTYTATPPRKPGAAYEYANLNYIVAGHMVEAAAKEDWEAMCRSTLAKELGMKSLAFGPPLRLKGHDAAGNATTIDNPATLGPAGTVNLTLDDWLKFCEVHAGHGPKDFLSKESLAKLHAPALDNYAMGWIVIKGGDGTPVLTHDGSNTMWYARAIVRPSDDRIVLVTLNKADQKACDEITAAVTVALFAPPTPRR